MRLRPRSKFLRLLAAGLALLCGVARAEGGDTGHLGAFFCANSTCHDAAMPSPGSRISQREYRIWLEHDKHSRAYTVLGSERAQAIARNLKIDSAQKAPACLACHADNVPVAQRGKRFKLEDGVSCEVCHGGAANWLGPHAIGASHADNVAAGMYPTDDPTARAKLCLGCHMFKGGDDYQHRYYTAGHPPLRFELDTYTEERPGHHTIDADYIKRKPGAYGARAWTLGQVAAARKLVDRATDTAGRGAWPDLATFACYGCHRTPGAGGLAQSTGLPIFQDAPLQMVVLIFDTLSPESAAPLRDRYQDFTKAIGSGADWKAAGTRLSAALVTAETALRARAAQPQDGSRLLGAVLKHALAGDYARQHVAEQATYALATLRLSDKSLAAINPPAADQALDALFTAAGHAAAFDAASWTTAAQSLSQALAVDAGP